MGDYFGGNVDEGAIKESFSLVYQLLEEMMDNGHPLTTEPNALKAMIQPPTTFARFVNATTGKVRPLVTVEIFMRIGSSECSRVTFSRRSIVPDDRSAAVRPIAPGTFSQHDRVFSILLVDFDVLSRIPGSLSIFQLKAFIDPAKVEIGTML